jgi:hypothetical protein
LYSYFTWLTTVAPEVLRASSDHVFLETLYGDENTTINVAWLVQLSLDLVALTFLSTFFPSALVALASVA